MKKYLPYILIVATGALLLIIAPLNRKPELPKLGAGNYTATFDTTGWSQKEINSIHAGISLILYENNVAHAGIQKQTDTSFIIVNPSNDPSSILTAQAILDTYEAEEAARQQAAALIEAEFNASIEAVNNSNMSAEQKEKVIERLELTR